MAATLIQSTLVEGPTKVRVLFYDDGSIRFRVYHTPLVIEEAFLTGGRNDHAILKVSPRKDSPK